MAADREVIKEFLVALGFNVQQQSLKKFTEALFSSEKLSKRTGIAVLSVAAAAEVMVAVFARSMEKMFYASQRTKSSVESLQALRFGAAQVGVEADTASSALESMSAILRTQPGSRALLEQILGEPTENKENLQLFYDLIRKLREMPHEMGSQFAAQFGMDEQTFFMLKTRLEELVAADQKRRGMNKDAGIDAQKAAAASREYMNTLRELWEMVGLLTQRLSIDLLPAFKTAAEGLNGFLKFLIKLDYTGFQHLLDSVDKQAEKWGKWADAVRIVTDSLRNLSDLFSKSPNALGNLFATIVGGPNYRNGGRYDGELFPKGSPGYDAAAKVLNGNQSFQEIQAELGSKMVALGMLRKLYERPHTLAEGDALEDAMLEHQNIISALRAQGFVPSGVTSPRALELMRYGEGANASGVTIQQHTEINVSGVHDPQAAGRAAAGEQGRVNSDLVRNARSAVN